ncbi:hypothetical protein H6P81_005320 [Aristolochia fimbriata]|uniref:Gnk2-homologous domain-containing protein n=1 Tax=Aristolochia fimbriata TaxID=158543 RepID=A0AAV7EXT1_ARIFI|nr:hypothetical protein H6P81_005320 [Aristolochia fimbriata]
MLRVLLNHSSPARFNQALKLFSFLQLLLLLLLHGYSHLTSAQPFVYVGCSQNKVQQDSPFEANLNSLLSSIVGSSSQSSYNSFAIGNGTSGPPDAAAYGLYQCRGDLKLDSCSNCVQNAVGQLGLVCAYSNGARLELDGCYVRYENMDFLSKLDTTLVHKKCSPKTSEEEEFFRRRDDVLADLQAGTGFRVSSLGMVEGIAQCLGDLSSEDCSKCLGEAVAKLKNVCGSAVAADAYLSQCYARYWASGYYSHADSSGDDQVGKTVAIIVGSLAGLAVFIVLLSFLRRAIS